MIRDFLNELNALQEKYRIYIDADCKEDFDYAWDGENEYPVVRDEPYVVFMNKGGYTIQGIYRDENMHYHMNH